MSSRQLTGVSLAALFGAGALFAAVSAQAAMSPLPLQTKASVQMVDCAVGAHIGPLGGCIIGTEDPPAVVIERRSADAPDSRDENGCTTKSIKRTDNNGNTETKTKTNC